MAAGLVAMLREEPEWLKLSEGRMLLRASSRLIRSTHLKEWFLNPDMSREERQRMRSNDEKLEMFMRAVEENPSMSLHAAEGIAKVIASQTNGALCFP